VGTEKMTMTLGSYTSRTIATGALVYSTSPQEVSFTHSDWGKYQVIGFMADKYLAGYTANTSSTNTRPTTDFSGISSLAGGGLHKVLVDDDTKRTITVGGTIALQDGYVLKATDVDLNRTMLLSLLKDGNEVDVSPLSAGETYVYSKNVSGIENLPLIMVRLDNLFSGQELQVAFIKGLFQVSEDATIVKPGNQFGNMEVTSVSQNGIEMTNSANIGLTKGTTADIMGDLKLKIANNDSAVRFALTVDNSSNQEVRSTVYRDSDSPPITEWTPYNFGINIGDTSLGFYYNLDDGVGSEDLKLINPLSSRTIPQNGLVYSTSPQEVPFTYTGFGKYEAIGFMADNYFAGYTSNTGVSNGNTIVTRPTTDFSGISTIANGNLHKVLIDDDTKRTIAVGGTIALQEGYVLKATDIDLNARTMLLSLMKDGTEVDVSPLSAGETYVYSKNVSGIENLPLIIVKLENVYSGQDQDAFLKGIFQISENPTSIKVGNQFGNMEVTSVASNIITMSNNGSIGLDTNKNDTLMGNIRLKVADNDAMRFYFSVDITPKIIANRLAIDAPLKAQAGDTIRINVTTSGNAMDNSSIMLDTDIGNTDKDGSLTYTLPKNLSGTYNITATKTGYEKATKNIEIEKYVDYNITDTIPPLINSVKLNKSTLNIGDAILITVNATDNVGVTIVKANGASLTVQGGNTFTWSGTITAIEDTHSVNVSASDAAGNIAWNNSTSYIAMTPPIPISGPFFLTATPLTVILDTPINVTFTVLYNSTLVSDATVILTGNAAGVGTTDSKGNVTISVKATGVGAITATVTKTGYENTTYPEILTATMPKSLLTGSISGMKFNDSNGNGTKDPGESGLSNWTIVLKNKTGSKVDTMMTDIDGNYIFGGLAAGNYAVEEVLQADWTQTFPSTKIYNLTLATGENMTGVDFGNNLIPPQESEVNAEREIEKESLGKGESTNITIRINSNVIQALALKEVIPAGWNLTRISDDANGFKNGTNEWVWLNVTPGITKTVTYAITAPTDVALGTYYINGTISNSSGVIAVVGGNNIIILDILAYYRGLGTNPDKVETRDLLKAMDDWRSKIVPPGFINPITNQELSALINEWAMN